MGPTQAHALVHAFLDQTPKTRRYMRAASLLVEGRPTGLQDASIRSDLQGMIRDGYLYTVEGDVFFLTALGKATREAFDAVAKAAREVG